ncbi:MAG: metal-sensitive transcriptional regulator [Candidatus Liptonbacteria bacterium]|nr:metal-sensitive transcriptional regulator [Candidatus Liptonbacteria bacterium]
MVNQHIKKRALHRARILEGQMKGLAKAIEEEQYCVDLMLQSLSIQESLKSLNRLLLENHLKTHVKHQLQKKGEEERAVQELIKVYTLSNK